LGNNEFSGPFPSVEKMTNLRVIFLNDNKFNGKILAGVGNCTNLEALYLHNNEFEGPLSEELCNCSELWCLSLYKNKNLDVSSFHRVLSKCKLNTLYIDKQQNSKIRQQLKDNSKIGRNNPKIRKMSEEELCTYAADAYEKIVYDKINAYVEDKMSDLAISVRVMKDTNLQDRNFNEKFGWDLALAYLLDVFNEF
jgi:DNA-dependent RNA polymerase auxiliary subunit epsilon